MIFIQKQWKYDSNFEQVKNLKNIDTKLAASETFYVLPFLVLEIFSIYYNIYLAFFLTLSKKAITLKFCLRLVRVFKSIFWKFGGFSVVRSSHKLRSNLAVFLTLNILTPFLVKTPVFWEMLLGSTHSTTQNLDVLAVVILKIWSHEIRSNFSIFLTLSISTTFSVKAPNFRDTLLGSSQSVTQTLDAIAVVVQEIFCHKLMPNLAVFLTLSMSTPFLVKAPNFRETLLSSSQSTT